MHLFSFYHIPCIRTVSVLYSRSYVALSIIVPLVGFVAVSVFRYIVNRPRPYEKFDMPPVIPKDTHGRSFPSRHVFSAFIIAFTVLICSPAASPFGSPALRLQSLQLSLPVSV